MGKVGFARLIDSLSTVATLDRWEPLYDKRTDYFYWKKPKLSRDVRMVKVSHETHLYVTPKGTVEGVFVEYLKNNFVGHNAEYRHMTTVFTKKVTDRKYTVGSRSRATTALFDKFAESLRADIYRDAVQDKKSIDDLEFIIAQAVNG